PGRSVKRLLGHPAPRDGPLNVYRLIPHPGTTHCPESNEPPHKYVSSSSKSTIIRPAPSISMIPILRNMEMLRLTVSRVSPIMLAISCFVSFSVISRRRPDDCGFG